MAENQQAFPLNWRIGQDFDPNEHLMQLKGRDYLNVQNRLLWFIRDQRALIVAGLAKLPYIVQTDLVEMDKQGNWAHFKTYVRDVLGNEATMYGSESAKDFGDFAEKASTKSLGRALLALGYGTAFAPEMDEGERVVDSPVDRKPAQQQQPRTMPSADDTRPVVTRQMTKDRARLQAEPVTDKTPITYTENEPAPAQPAQPGRNELGVPTGGMQELFAYATQEIGLTPKGWNDIATSCHREPDAIRAHFNHIKRTALENRAKAGKGAA